MPDKKVTLLRRRKVVRYEQAEVELIVTEQQIAAWAEANELEPDELTDDEMALLVRELYPELTTDAWEVTGDDTEELEGEIEVEDLIVGIDMGREEQA